VGRNCSRARVMRLPRRPSNKLYRRGRSGFYNAPPQGNYDPNKLHASPSIDMMSIYG
jgi:hypothetical protein